MGTDTLNGEQGHGSTRDSKFLYSEHNGRAELEVDHTDSWGGNHSCGIGEMTSMGDSWGTRERTAMGNNWGSN